jgi:hypothetical protein
MKIDRGEGDAGTFLSSFSKKWQTRDPKCINLKTQQRALAYELAPYATVNEIHPQGSSSGLGWNIANT